MIKPVNPKLLSVVAISISLLTELFVVLEFFVFSSPGPNIVPAILIFSFYGVLFLLIYFFDRYPLIMNLIFGSSLSLIVIALWVYPAHQTNFLVLIYPIAAFSTIYLSLWNGVIWVTGLYVFSQVIIAVQFGFQEFVSNLAAIGAFASYAFIGALIRRSNQAYYSIENLYDDLQQAHDQLKEYSQSVRELAVSEERNRLAREMHDSLGHSLTVAIVQLEGAERLIPTDPQRAAGIIANMRQQLKDSLGELRKTLSQLREPQEDETPPVGNLPLALADLESTFSEATGLTIHLDLPDNLPALTTEQRLAFYRVAQEGLTNVQRHANATQAWVKISLRDHQIAMTVSDDGSGLPDDRPDGRFGLRGLAERARVLKGTFDMINRPDGGAEIEFTMPLQPRNGVDHS